MAFTGVTNAHGPSPHLGILLRLYKKYTHQI